MTREARIIVGEGALLTVTDAAGLLGFRGAREWLAAEGLVSEIPQGDRIVRRVVWRRVLARLDGSDSEPRPAPPSRKRYRLAD